MTDIDEDIEDMQKVIEGACPQCVDTGVYETKRKFLGIAYWTDMWYCRKCNVAADNHRAWRTGDYS